MISIIGPLTKIVDPTAEALETVTNPRFHVNSSEPLTVPVEYLVQPKTPELSFSGSPTYYYVFPDRETAERYGIMEDSNVE